MAPWCIYISCLERSARSGSGSDSVRGSVGAMYAELSRPSGRKQAQSRVCTLGFIHTNLVTQSLVYFSTLLISCFVHSFARSFSESKISFNKTFSHRCQHYWTRLTPDDFFIREKHPKAIATSESRASVC